VEYADQIVGLDLAENMVSEYNKAATELGMSEERMHAYVYNLLDDDESTASPPVDLTDFDIAIVSMALHHVSDPGQLLQRLAKTLKLGGVCVILDMVPEQVPERMPNPDPEVLQTINKRGFTNGEMMHLYKLAGMDKNVDYVAIEKPFEMKMHGKEISIAAFISRAELV
jgi:SAM-dependent methyltransferase